MITKTLFGIDFFDEYYGGVYRGRPVLLTGRKGLGKTSIAMHFLCQGLKQDEPCLMLSTLPNYNLDLYADMLGFSMAAHVNAGRLVLLECTNFNDDLGSEMLPPEGFSQLREIIDSHMIQRMVIDNVVPFLAVNPPERINEHIYSFMRSFDRLGVTTLMTLPKPVSPMAIRLKNSLEATLPISILLNPSDDLSSYTFQVVKYIGATKLAPPVNYQVKPGEGVTGCSPPAGPSHAESEPQPAPASAVLPARAAPVSPPASAPAPVQAAPAPSPAPAPSAPSFTPVSPSTPVSPGLKMSTARAPSSNNNGGSGNGRNKAIEEAKPMPADVGKPSTLIPSSGNGNGKLRLSLHW